MSDRASESVPGPSRSRSTPFARLASGAALAVSAFLLSAAPALAGPPTHVRKEALDIGGFNHACGTAVDSKGDVYVSSAGESKIRIFDPAHAELTFIANGNEPCGLAVDSNGILYVSEKGTGKVVRYKPNAYPFSGTPSYEPPVTIDSSGEAEGISVDPTDDRLYVAEGSHISTYGSEGNLGIDEVQRVRCFEATGGTYTLSFKGSEPTVGIPCKSSAEVVEKALEALSTIGAGNVSVSNPGNVSVSAEHFVTFTDALGHTDVSMLAADPTGLTGTGSTPMVLEEKARGFSGHIGEGSLTEATGVAAYTYKVDSETSDRYVFAADAATDRVKVFGGADIRILKLRRTLDGPEAAEDFGFGTAGAYLAVDPGNGNPGTKKCSSIAEQACTAGHLLVYDEAHKVVDEFEAGGEFLDQFTNAAFADAKPTALAVERSGGPGDGTIYVTAGAGAGAKLLAFGPLAAPSRPPRPELSHVLTTAQAVATDSAGDVYAAAGSTIHVYGPDGKEIEAGSAGKGIETSEPSPPADLAVDSACNVYIQIGPGLGGDPAEHKVQSYTPASCPPEDGTQYSGPVTVATGNSFQKPTSVEAIGINPANDHVFVAGYNNGQILELGSAAEGSPILDPCFACSLPLPSPHGIGVYGANGHVYVSGVGGGTVFVIDSTGTEVLARITGAGSTKGPFSGPTGVIAVNQANGHALIFENIRGVAEEYDAAGAFVAQFAFPEPQGFSTGISKPSGVAIDSACALHEPPLSEATTPTCKEFDPANGNVYVAFDDTKGNTPDLWAFGPLAYGEPPAAVTGIADGLGAGNATLHGTVDPRGFDLTECKFEYLTDAQYLSNGKTFTGATSQTCAESLAEIGKGTEPVPVHANIVAGLDPEARYRFRLVAENKYGKSPEGKAGLFGPPLLTAKTALPILYDEATLRAEIDPSGLATKYRFEYGTSTAYGSSTPLIELPPGDGPVAVKAPLTGLAEGSEYHFRIVAENEAKAVPGPGQGDQTLVTLARRPAEACPNSEYRTGLSAQLPDCRAYELVTPAETGGKMPVEATTGSAGKIFNNWLVKPRGEGAGESVAYFIYGTLPGFEGNGRLDGYRAQRGAGAHPAEGWANELVGPSYALAEGGLPFLLGVASDQRYSLWTFPAGSYLRTPAGFEPLGQGSLGADPSAEGRFLSAGGAHVVFFSDKHLEEGAAPEGTVAIYDRAAGAANAEVVSVKPDGSPFGAGEDATYLGASEDGTAIAFRVGGALYLHREGQTTEIATAPNAFAGISEDGKRVFYAATSAGESAAPAAPLFLCDTEAGSCTGSEAAQEPSEIASHAIFVNVSPDGSHAFFTSEEALTGPAEENENHEHAEAGKHNLYAWDGVGVHFVAILDSRDFERSGFGDEVEQRLSLWTTAVSAGPNIGRASSPTRATPDGQVLLFQSHAQLSAYENEGKGEIYRYEPAAPAERRLTCVSCDPTRAPPSGDAMLQVNSSVLGSGTRTYTLITNVTDNGQEVFFHSPDRLLPEDANDAVDVYEWKAQGAGGCERAGGCLALISSGQGEGPSYLFGMSADGHDVFLQSSEKLVGADIPTSPSLYDARVEGGIPDPPTAAPCQGDACQGQGSAPPVLPSPASTGSGDGNVERRPPRPCAKGKHRVKGRCVAKHHMRVRHHRRANRNRRAGR